MISMQSRKKRENWVRANVSAQVLFKKYVCLCTKDRHGLVISLASRKVNPYNKIESTFEHMVVPCVNTIELFFPLGLPLFMWCTDMDLERLLRAITKTSIVTNIAQTERGLLAAEGRNPSLIAAVLPLQRVTTLLCHYLPANLGEQLLV